jgi:hypothetical protein
MDSTCSYCIIVFAAGAFINIKSDNILLALHNLGEIVEWFGFAILTWSLPAHFTTINGTNKNLPTTDRKALLPKLL